METVQTKQEIEKIRTILPRAQRIIDSITKLDEDAKWIAGQSAKFFGIDSLGKDRYGNPLYAGGSEFGGIKGLDEHLSYFVEKVVRTWQKALVPNLDISAKKIIEEQTVMFNKDGGGTEERNMEVKGIPRIDWLFDLFLEKYVKNAEKLSRDKILEDARRYVPRNCDQRYTNTFPKVSEILKNKTLTLDAMTYSYDSFHESEQNTAIEKLGKLIGIVDGQSAIDITTEDWNWFIDSANFYKNGKWTIKFKDEDLAKKVATVLVEGWKEK